ncbi:MAG TPA: hypothetical protein RMH99_22790, partial [Sandaracinaceae bacterium LLY-WYZ-13_1]|nr:hypothetical protein [Sandaracinaceae bacterium LLY-WYZ-13_1]
TEGAMGDIELEAIQRAAAQALRAANEWRGERWYEPPDLELTLRFGGPEPAPTVAGWQAELGNLEVSGAATPQIALELLRDVFLNLTANERRGGRR